MKVVNLEDIQESEWQTPLGKFACADREISVALGRVPTSSDLMLRHPFDVALCRVPPGKSAFPYHSHSAQWEFYHVLSGSGAMRHERGLAPLRPGDSCMLKPGEAHQLQNTGTEDLVVLVVADNPLGESSHYPDSNKWLVRSPERRIIRSEPLDYVDGEEP